jgi:hypothetical protein
MLDLFSSPTLMKFNAIKNMLNFVSTKDIYMHQHIYIACWVKGEKEKEKSGLLKCLSRMVQSLEQYR